MTLRPMPPDRRRPPARGPALARTAALLAALALGLAACVAPRPEPAADRDPVRVRVLAFNDLHGYLEPGGLALRLADPRDPSAAPLQVGAGGVAHLATLVRRLRGEVPHSVLVSSGDAIGASPLVSALFREEPTIEAMNAIGVDLAVVGNHEFDRGIAELRRLAAGGCHPGDASPLASCAAPEGRFGGARFPLFAANVLDQAGRPVFAPSVVREFDGVRVAFVGAVVRATPTIVSPAGVAGLRFEDEAESINREVDRLREAQGIRAFVAVIHEGGAIDGDWNDPRCPGARGAVFAIADRLRPEVDAVLSAHTHQGYSCVRDAPGNPGLRILQATSYGRGLSVLDLAIDRSSGDVLRPRTAARNLPVANGLGGDRAADAVHPPVPADPAVGAIVAHFAARAAPLARSEVGRISAAARRGDAGPGGDSTLGRLVADAQLAATREPGRGGARIAFTNPGGLRADLGCATAEAPCAVRFGDAFAAQPFGNSLVVMTLTGAQLRAALEQQFTGTNAERPRILQPSAGFTFSWRRDARDGARLVDARLDGEPLSPSADYRVTVNSFLAEGGDGFTVFRDGSRRLGGAQDVDALVDWLRSAPVVAPPRGARVSRAD